jgi:sugar/nucleoside kinase (ribokinase family)
MCVTRRHDSPNMLEASATGYRRTAGAVARRAVKHVPRARLYRSLHIGSLYKDSIIETKFSRADYRAAWEVGDTKMSGRVRRRRPTLGGSAGNTARAAAALGFCPTVAAVVGDDDAGRFVRNQLTSLGILQTYVLVESGHSARSEVILAKDGHVVLSSNGVATAPPYVPVHDINRGRFAMITVGSLKRPWRQAVLGAVVEGLQACPNPVVLAINIEDDWIPSDFNVLRYIRDQHSLFYQGNWLECQSSAHSVFSGSMPQASCPIRILHRLCGSPLVGTCGPQGSYCLNGEPRCLHVDALHISAPVTPVGLGDTHIATLAGMLALKYDWAAAAIGATVASAHRAMDRPLPGHGGPAEQVAVRLLEWTTRKGRPRARWLPLT